MKKAFFMLALLSLLALGSGCAQFGTYMKDRGNDLADCFTARVGLNYGIGARVKITDYFSVSAGCWRCQNETGYFGREAHELKVERWHAGIPVSQLASLFFLAGIEPSIGLGLLLGTETIFEERFGAKSYILGINTNELKEHIIDVFLFPAPIGKLYPESPYLRHKFFVEAALRLFFFGLDIGFNPVEFVDFLLGWATIDITGDDTKATFAPAPEKPNQIK